MSVDLRPRAATDATAVVLDGEAVIHRSGEVHTLDPVATLVWRCCDGSASVAEIAADLASGFDADAATVERDVAATISELDRLGLLAPDGADGPEPAAGAPVELLVDPPGSCAACAERTWAHRRALYVGGRLLAVATNDVRADTAIEAALAGHLLPEPDVLAAEPPFLAVELHSRAPGPGRQRLDLVVRRDAAVARSRRPDRILRALVAHVASYGDLTGLGLAALRGTVVGRGGRVLLVPEVEEPVRFRRELAALGIAAADQPVALVDPTAREVVVGAPGVEVDLSAFAALAPEPSAAADEPAPLAWGRYALAGLGVHAPASTAAALLAFGPDADDRRDHAATIAALVALLADVPVVDAVTPDAIAAHLRDR
jgi:PqqD family protein of HPr-rel-A system